MNINYRALKKLTEAKLQKAKKGDLLLIDLADAETTIKDLKKMGIKAIQVNGPGMYGDDIKILDPKKVKSPEFIKWFKFNNFDKDDLVTEIAKDTKTVDLDDITDKKLNKKAWNFLKKGKKVFYNAKEKDVDTWTNLGKEVESVNDLYKYTDWKAVIAPSKRF